jgi:hypothetical protein
MLTPRRIAFIILVTLFGCQSAMGASISLDQEKFDFDKLKYSKSEEREEARFRADLASRRWSLFATFVPVIAIIVGLFANIQLESVKKLNAEASIFGYRGALGDRSLQV